jgi:hypothetical protein
LKNGARVLLITNSIPFFNLNYIENTPMISLSAGACLREAASAKAGERVAVRGIGKRHQVLWNGY